MLSLIQNQNLINLISNIAFILEMVAVVVISGAVILAVFNFLRHYFSHDRAEICVDAFKTTVGKSVQVALEILIAADIINTVVLDATLQNVLVLGFLVIIRTFLSWTLTLETDGHWPWHNSRGSGSANQLNS
jgi:uncharacterized membrane protein